MLNQAIYFLHKCTPNSAGQTKLLKENRVYYDLLATSLGIFLLWQLLQGVEFDPTFCNYSNNK